VILIDDVFLISYSNNDRNRILIIIIVLIVIIVTATRNVFCRTWYLSHKQVHNDQTFPNNNGYIAYFSLRMHEMAVFPLSVLNLTSP